MVDFCCPPLYVTISKGSSLSSSEAEISVGIRSWKTHICSSTERQKAIGGFRFSQELTAATLQPGLKFDNFKRHFERKILKCFFCLTVHASAVMIRIF
jgi:hypothetical protein